MSYLNINLEILLNERYLKGGMNVHIIYHCCDGCYSSATAAAIHLNMLPIDYRPSYHDLANIPFYDNFSESDRGRIILRGTDEYNNNIYTLSRKHAPHIVLPTIHDMWKALEQDEKELIFINTQSCVNRAMRFGSFFSKNSNSSNFGSRMVAKATLGSYEQISNVVREAKGLLH